MTALSLVSLLSALVDDDEDFTYELAAAPTAQIIEKVVNVVRNEESTPA